MKVSMENGGLWTTRIQLLVWSGIILIMILLSLAWRFTALRTLIDVGSILSSGLFIESWLWAGVTVVLVYTIGGLVAFPIVILIPATAVLFGPAAGFCYSLVALLANAVVLYALGYYGNKKTLSVLDNNRFKHIQQKLSRHSFAAIVVLRLLPAAPYTVINLLAGAFHVPFGRYASGTLIGIIPSVIIMTLIGDQFKKIFQENLSQHPIIFLVAVIVLIALSAVVWKQLSRVRMKN
jgi:phospholipase D1/2